MHAYGLSINACKFMFSYLSDIYQRVKVINVQLHGYHCSNLDLFLFNIFMNDIYYFIDICDLANYADDNTLSIIASTIELVLAALTTKY